MSDGNNSYLTAVYSFLYVSLLLLEGGASAAEADYDCFPPGYYNSGRLPAKTVYLTFDDGPSDWTGRVLDVLSQEKVKATFFISSHFSKQKNSSFLRYRKDLQRMTRQGHSIGNHSSEHRMFSRLDSADIIKELTSNQELLSQALGKEAPLMTLVRPPMGDPWFWKGSLKEKSRVGNIIKKFGALIMWSRKGDSSDSWEWAGGEYYRRASGIDRNSREYIEKKMRIYRRVTSAADGRGIVLLFHDTHPTTADILKKIIRKLKERGYKFRTAEELIMWKYGKGSRELIGDD